MKLTHVAGYIRERRLELGLTQAAVASSLGYKPQFVTNWERGTSQPPARALPKLCRVLKTSRVAMLHMLTLDSADYWSGVLNERWP